MTVDNSNLTLQQHIKEQTVNLINYTEIIKNMTNTLLENKARLRILKQIIETREAELIRLKRVRKQKKIIYFILINSTKKHIKLIFGRYSYKKSVSKKLVTSKIFINLSPGTIGFKKAVRRTKHAILTLRQKFIKLLFTKFKKIIKKRRIILRLRGNMKRSKLIFKKLLRLKMNIRSTIIEGPIAYNGIRLAKKKRK